MTIAVAEWVGFSCMEHDVVALVDSNFAVDINYFDFFPLPSKFFSRNFTDYTIIILC